jgi:hypothetical protein
MSMTFVSSCEYRTCMGSYTPLDTFLPSDSISRAVKGGRMLAISYMTQPMDQMSHLPSYGWSFHTSGEA